METKNLTEKSIEKIAKLFPNVITEMKDENGKLKKGINFELLKQELSEDVIEGEECYDFTWVGKKAAIVESNTPIRKTLRPCIDESKNWENTENLYIEGDNLEVLKLLQESYLNSIKMIYIDPPYNTGNDFIYRDNFKTDKDEYEEQIGLYDENENMMFKNTDTNGRFHSDWCSMMYPRLKLAYNLLCEDGAIFISIDDNEVDNLKKICNEIFGETNFIAQFPWQSRLSIQNDTDISNNHEYVIAYAKVRRKENRRLKKSNAFKWFKEKSFVFLPLTLDRDKFDNPDNDPRGPWKADPFDAPNIRPNLTYKIVNPNTYEEYLPPNGRCWRTEEKTYEKLLADNRIIFGKTGNSRPQLKVFYEEKKFFGSIDNTWWSGEKCGTSTQGTKELMSIFEGFSPFDTPKPVTLLLKILSLVSLPKNNDIILDFFSGSSTTAHAVIQMNMNDDGNRKFIMVQVPEKINENSEAYKAGYKNICEIGKERIRRTGEKIKSEIEETNRKLKDNEEPKKVPDIGFRVLKIDSTNMKDVYYSANEYTQEKIADLVSNIKEDRTDLDLLYGAMLDWGLPLSLKHEMKKIDGVTIHIVDEGSLVACFEENLSENAIREITKLQPVRVVFRDSCFENSPEKINVEEIFKLLAPNTTIRVI
jgi:adenine-specific DNA-methyltransferase